MKKANAGIAEKVCVDLINMNLIFTLPNVYVLPALISKFPLQVNVSIAVKMKLS
jgi:hypothetical protein